MSQINSRIERQLECMNGAFTQAQDQGVGFVMSRDTCLNKGGTLENGYQMAKTRSIPRMGQGGPAGIGAMVQLDTELTRSFEIKPPRSELWGETQNMEVEYAYFQPNLGDYQNMAYDGIAQAYTRYGFQNGVYGPEK